MTGPYGGINAADIIPLLGDPQLQNAIRALIPPGWTVPSTSAPGDTPSPGTFPAWAPMDHVHGREGADSNDAPLVENVNIVAASGAAVTIPDVTVATQNKVTLTSNCTFTFPGTPAGKSFLIELVQDATGSRLATWPASVIWAGGTHTLSTAAGAIDLASFVSLDGVKWLGNLATAYA